MKRRLPIVVVVSAIAILGLFASLAATGAFGQKSDDPRPPDKQTLEASAAARQATVDAMPQSDSTKDMTPPEYAPAPTPQSCPVDPAGIRVAINSPPITELPLWPELYDQKGHSPIKVISDATGVTREGAPFRILAGALANDTQQGVIVVGLASRDPCYEHKPYFSASEYVTPFKAGALTVKRIDGDTAVFLAGGGTTGGFDFVQGVFSNTQSPTLVPTVVTP